jgi:hypothetical protein
MINKTKINTWQRVVIINSFRLSGSIFASLKQTRIFLGFLNKKVMCYEQILRSAPFKHKKKKWLGMISVLFLFITQNPRDNLYTFLWRIFYCARSSHFFILRLSLTESLNYWKRLLAVLSNSIGDGELLVE